MANHPQQQLLSMIAELDQALEKHEHWYNEIVRTFIAHLPPPAPDLLPDAHRHCAFGQWYGSPQSQLLQTHPAFAALGKAHETMHGIATALLRRLADGRAISADEIDSFTSARDRMKLQIQSWRQELADVVQNCDPLTGARNRLTMLADLREQHALVKRGAQPCAIALFDIDKFKDVNDRLGHLAGDSVLASIVHTVESIIRPYDRIYRYGGEEFLLCMPNTTTEAAGLLAERIRTAIAKDAIEAHSGATVRVTVSIGVAPLHDVRPVEEAIDQADRLLYRAKELGRNRVEVAGSPG